jgi:putative flippase GtrA
MSTRTEVIFRPSLASHVIFTRYVLFAIVSGLANLAFQEIVVRTVPTLPIMVSVLSGTSVGFWVKYLLEKRWVFLDVYDGHAAEIRKIAIYGIFGIVTTLLFWAIELSFWHMWQTVGAKYVGATIGLSLGNWTKYLLDRRYVFPRNRT